MRRAAAFLIRVYQWTVSPLLGPACRFYPSCSNYALQAIEAFGLVRGGWLALGRLARCHPWNPGGYDPVPPACGHSRPLIVGPTAPAARPLAAHAADLAGSTLACTHHTHD